MNKLLGLQRGRSKSSSLSLKGGGFALAKTEGLLNKIAINENKIKSISKFKYIISPSAKGGHPSFLKRGAKKGKKRQ